ncbi:uncharacterized protein Z518_06062 [Rhinocladiella mackenziei CBS 650.93]|uniref:RRM domain-containing protein n=1 Tax=Rhinocladiella mackenziei CBS 650.93 TaxID=1442369 RepID=A0A0D2J809_9EURO|nr:uncharacterized protein Z518_06062 [Rhinocladiella mackenziei CBS 650.93]KIX05190.1 hypothetical protein Z518_06062 [Rhinocladiella mackenziei CBS 650.93]
MTSHLATSKSSTPPVIIPALPLSSNRARTPATTNQNRSPPGEMDGSNEDSNAGKPEKGGEKVAKTDSSGVLECQKPIEPRPDDDVFGASTASEPAKDLAAAIQNPVARRITSNLRIPLGYNGFAPRPDRVAQLPNAANAQGLYSPDALIFVANLSNRRTEDQLALSCHQVFDCFGPCHIKVRLDKNRHPFAFVQFEARIQIQRIEDAHNAVNGASSLAIDGRKIRIERAKAERAVILSKSDGSAITEVEARELLERYGPIEHCASTDIVTHDKYNVHKSIYVKFAYYLDCRDALRGFPNHTLGYSLHMAPSLEPRLHPGPNNNSPVIRGFPTPRSAADQKSIFVGNLPDDTTRQELEELFMEFGTIVQINIIKKTFGANGANIFSFIEFSNPQEADCASNAERIVRGSKLRVEPKEYSARRPRHTAFAPTTPVHQTTTRNFVDTRCSAPRMNHNPPNMYAMQQMTTPPSVYGQGFSMQAYPPHHVASIATPPTFSVMNRMASMGMFSPTPAQTMHPYGLPAAPRYASPMYGGYRMMGPIQETGKEGF